MKTSIQVTFSLAVTVLLLFGAGCRSVSSDPKQDQPEAPLRQTGGVAAPPGVAGNSQDTEGLFGEFQDRIEAYLKLREEALRGIDKPDDSDMPEDIQAYQEKLRERLIRARSDAVRGLIFFPAIEDWFRAAIDARIQGRAERQAKWLPLR